MQIWIYRALVACTPRLKGPRRDVVLQQLVVHDVDDGRDELLDVLGSPYQGLNVI